MCWSYILSVRLLELQRKKPIYTQDYLLPITAKSTSEGEVLLDLGASATPKLVRWLCTILAPRPGWAADGGGFPPWAAFCSGHVRFVVATADGPESFFSLNESSPPTSVEATELLIQFCAMYGLLEPEHLPENHQPGSHHPKDHQPGNHQPELSPAIAAFLAALVLPFYRSDGLRPQFPSPVLKRCSSGTAKGTRESARIRQYTADLRYYMTLSLNTKCLGSALWSIFWQPDIEANLVSPWLSAIACVLKPILESRDLGQLAKGLCMPPSPDCFVVARHLSPWRLHYPGPDHPLSRNTRGAWCGLRLHGPPGYHRGRLDRVPLVVPRRRVPRSVHVPESTHFEGRRAATPPQLSPPGRLLPDFVLAPFRARPREWVEPDLWPWLERGHVREYVHWVWWIKTTKGWVQDVQLGFRKDTGRFVADVPNHLSTVRGPGRIAATVIRLGRRGTRPFAC